MRSVHVTNYYHKNSGGISTSYNNLLAAAERHERYVSLIVPGENESTEIINPFAKIYYVPAKYSPIFDKRYRIMMPWQYMVSDSIIRRILLEEMPDMIEVTDKYTLSILGPMIRTNNFKKLGRPMLVHFSCERMDDNVGSFLTSGKAGKWFARRIIANYILPSFDFHLANSAYTAEEFNHAISPSRNKHRSNAVLGRCWRFLKAPRVPLEERSFVCPRGVDAGMFTPEKRSATIRRSMIERAEVPNDSIILLYAGRISPEKNIELLVKMMEALGDSPHDIRLLVAGAGPQSEWLRKEGEKLGKKKVVQFGHVDKETLAGYYANADIFVHPNPHEPFGIAPLEAMASGVPTVAPHSGGILSYANNENAWLVEPTGDAFAKSVIDVIENEETRRQKVEQAIATARANTREVSTDRLFSTYDHIYKYFLDRKDLFTDIEAASTFDHVKEFLDREPGDPQMVSPGEPLNDEKVKKEHA